MPLRVPPPEIPVISWLSPNKADQGLLEFWNTELASYTPLDVGAPHPNQREFPNFRLGKQAPLQGDEKWVLRVWVTDETSPDWFNWALKYSGEDNEFPIFIRTYREPRATYTPRVKGTTLGTLYKTVMTNVGSGYASGAYPSVTFSEPSVTPTSVAIGHGVVSAGGSVTEVVLDFGGEGYFQDVEFTVAVPISGDQATGVAYVQPQIAILVREEASLYPPDSEFYAQYLQVTRVYETIPGPTFNQTEFAEDGVIVNVATTRKLCSDITSTESIVTGTWCQTTSKPTDIDVICEEIVKCRTVPGLPMADIKIEKDGKELEIVKTLKDVLTITPSETVSGGGVWIKTEQEDYPGTSLVAWEVVTARDALGNIVPSAKVDGDSEVALIQTRLRKTGDITPSSTESGGIITTVEKGEVGDLVSQQITTAVPWLDKAFFSQRIPDSVIPVEFRAAIPTVTESHVLAGLASAAGATLSGSQLFVAEQQLTKLLYEHRTEDFGTIGFPIIQTNYETTEEYGGGILEVIRTLNDSVLTVDQGYLVVRSEVREIGQSYLWFKETATLFGASEWPELIGTHVDEKYGIAVGIQKQVLVAGITGGGSGNTIIEVKPIDRWRSVQITSTLDTDSLPAPEVWYSGMRYSFPPVLTDQVIDWAYAFCGCSSSFAAILVANLDQYSGPVKTRITEQFYNGAPPDDVVIYQFFPQSHDFGYAWSSFCGDDDGNCTTKSGAPEFNIPLCLHGDISLSIGAFTTWFFPATTPSALPSGNYIMLPPHVERWRFGVFRRVLTEVLVP